MKWKYIPAALVVAIAVALAGCNNTQTRASQCAYQIENGYFDARHISAILHPGERRDESGTFSKYVYCNARNYAVAKDKNAVADSYTPIEAKTAANSYGDGTPVDVYGTVYFGLNQNEDVMRQFLGFCEKYNCFGSNDADASSNQAHSSSAGWNNMLAENMRFALQRATQRAMLEFAPDVWNDQSKWPKIADTIAEDMRDQLRNVTGTAAAVAPGEEPADYFCGSGVRLNKGAHEHEPGAWTCPRIRVVIDQIDPQDPDVRTIYNQQVQQQYERQLADEAKKTNEAKLSAAKAKYGDAYAGYFLGMQDVCQGSTTCVIGDPRQVVGK